MIEARVWGEFQILYWSWKTTIDLILRTAGRMVMIHFIFPKLIFLSLVKYFKAKAEPSPPVFLLKTEIVMSCLLSSKKKGFARVIFSNIIRYCRRSGSANFAIYISLLIFDVVLLSEAWRKDSNKKYMPTA